MYREIEKCRICGNSELDSVFHLGNQCLTGIFPSSEDESVTSGPLELVKCREDKKGEHCGLLQLRQSFDLDEMYGANYGYRSGLNQSMVEHLNRKVQSILKYVDIDPGDLILDIGSNDSTLLRAYPENSATLVGFDPTGEKFKEYYPKHIHLVADFFNVKSFKENFGNKKAKIITSIAMFYDLEAPLLFMKEISELLAEKGVWIFEQSYMPVMLENNSYDTVCHEHLEYYGLKQIKWMTDKAGLKILNIEFNAINGGSFSVTAAKKESPLPECGDEMRKVLRDEEARELSLLKPYEKFKERACETREDLRAFIHSAKKDGKKILGYGASTKGNVILQFCELTKADLPFIAEVNKDKFGHFTPGTHIPIISEKEAKLMKPDYFLVLPWHFKSFFLEKEKEYLGHGGKLVMPLPSLEIV